MSNLGVYVFGLCVVRLGFEVRSAESSRDYGNYRTCQVARGQTNQIEMRDKKIEHLIKEGFGSYAFYLNTENYSFN